MKKLSKHKLFEIPESKVQPPQKQQRKSLTKTEKKGYLYILRTYGEEDQLIKLGNTSNIEKRYKTYLTHNPLCTWLHIFQMKNAKKFETEFHKKYPASVGTEWYGKNIYEHLLEKVRKQNSAEIEFEIINYKLNIHGNINELGM